jgi:hypothetical protein
LLRLASTCLRTLRQRVDEARAPQAASTSQNKVLNNLTTLDQTIGSTGFIYALVSPYSILMSSTHHLAGPSGKAR